MLRAALVDGRLARRTIPLLGPTELGLEAAVQVVAEATGRRRPVVRVPVGPHPYDLASVSAGLPAPGRFTRADLRCPSSR